MAEQVRTLLEALAIDRSVPTAPYYQLRERIRQAIESGRLASGERLPTVRQLAQALEVSPFTVSRAFTDLAREGLLVSRTRAGTRVAHRRVPSIEVLIPVGEGLHLPPLGFFNEILDGIREVFSGSGRRCFLSYVDAEHVSAPEILAVCRARRADGLLAYRPDGHLAAEIRKVAEHIATASLIYPVPEAMVDWVGVDAAGALRQLLRDRLAAGRRTFAFVALEGHLSEVAGIPSPYLMMRRAFDEFTREAGLEPRTFIVPGARWSKEADGQIFAFAQSLPEDAVVVGAFPSLVANFNRWRPTCETIAYTESATTLEQYRDRVNILYAGIRKCARVAVGLLREHIEGKAGAAPRTVQIVPDVIPTGSRERR